MSAFIFLVLAALSQIALPLFLGKAIDSVAFKGDSDEYRFHLNICILAAIGVCCGIFSGCRGMLFTLAEAKLSVRLNRDLFRSIINHDIVR